MQCKFCNERFATQRDLDWHRVEVVDNRRFKSREIEYICLFLGFLQSRKTEVWKIDPLQIEALTQQRKVRLQAVRRQIDKSKPKSGLGVAS